MRTWIYGVVMVWTWGACSSQTVVEPRLNNPVGQVHVMEVPGDVPGPDWKGNRERARALLISSRIGEGETILAWLEPPPPRIPRSLPKNSRQIAEGYWLGGKPGAEDIRAMHEAGIRLVISATRLKADAAAVADELGMERLTVWFGRTFPSAQRITEASSRYQPEEIFVHCDHGGDRSGAIVAFLLSTRHSWRPDHALLAVAYPTSSDVRNLIKLLEAHGAQITREERTEYVGIYSGQRNGGFGGLKVRGPTYEQMVSTTLDAMASSGVELVD